METIRIINLKIHANHGVHESEKLNGQVFEIDLEIITNLKIAMVSDNLDDTISYENLVKSITNKFTEKRYNLIEKIGNEICDFLFDKYDMKQVTLRIRKPNAPINADFDAVELEFVRKG